MLLTFVVCAPLFSCALQDINYCYYHLVHQSGRQRDTKINCFRQPYSMRPGPRNNKSSCESDVLPTKTIQAVGGECGVRPIDEMRIDISSCGALT